MSAPTPRVSVIIPTYNRCDVVERTLRHLLAQDYPHSKLEILVCDNSTDATPRMVEAMAAAAPSAAAVVLLASDERLPAVKRNHGIGRATGDLVIFMNDDVWVRPDFIGHHVASHAAWNGPVAVLGHVEQSTQMDQTPFAQWYRPFAYDEIADRVGVPLGYRYSWSMNLSFPRQVMLDQSLLFHEGWAHIGHEDVELGYRWQRAGFPLIYNPAAWGEHYHPHDIDSVCRLQESIGRGLRDLEVLVDDDGLLERYGVFSWTNSSRSVVRGVVRRALFNRVTVPRVQRWQAARTSRSRVAEWSYWKVMLHYTNRGYRSESPRPRRAGAELVGGRA